MNETGIDSKREQIKALRQRSIPLKGSRDYWTDAERQQLERMYCEGDGISEIALTFGRSETAIQNQIKALGLHQRIRAPRQEKARCCPKCPHYPECEGGFCRVQESSR